MNRYLEAEWLKSRVHDVPLANGAIHGCVDKLDLIEAPSIEIVRCRECKYFWKHSDLPTRCVFHLSLVNADDFCSYGVNCSEKPNNSKVSEKPTGSDRNYVDVRGAK